jgi:transcriptional regulator with XRE-family HTH domain
MQVFFRIFQLACMAKVRKTKIELAVAQQVTRIRHARNYTQDDLAAMLECSRGFIGQIESPNSPSTYSLSQLNRLAFEFGCTLHDLIPKQPMPEEGWE